MGEFSQRRGLDLSDPFASETIDLADFFESVVASFVETETEPDYVGFPRLERAEHSVEHSRGR